MQRPVGRPPTVKVQRLKTAIVYSTFFHNAHAHLPEIRKSQLTVRILVHEGVDFYVQNVLKLTRKHL